jgi:hypothetical protein
LTNENGEFTNDKWNLSSKNVHKYTQMMISPPPPPTTTPTTTHQKTGIKPTTRDATPQWGYD